MNHRETARLHKLYVELKDAAKQEDNLFESTEKEEQKWICLGASHAFRFAARRIYEIFLQKEE